MEAPGADLLGSVTGFIYGKPWARVSPGGQVSEVPGLDGIKRR